MPAGSEIIYLGWIMAGGIKGYKEAAKLYKVRAVCGIGMGQTCTPRKSNTYGALIISNGVDISIPFSARARTVSLFVFPSDSNKRS